MSGPGRLPATKQAPAAGEPRGAQGSRGRMEGPEPDMLIALHKNATTTPAIRAALQQATGSDYELARRFKLSRDTVRKWRRREGVHDASHTAHRLQTTLDAG